MPNYTPAQLEAINTLDQNLQIIACAGSGKTQVISERIVNLLRTGVVPKRIIAFTYTNKAAGELQSRILKLCREQLPNASGLADMYVGTIHGWCLKTLQDYKYEYQKFSLLDEIKLKLFVDRKFKHIGMQRLNMERYKDTGHFIQLLSIAREAELAPGSEMPEHIQEALKEYETTLKKSCFLDFTMIMKLVLHYMDSDAAFRQRIAGNAGYLIVDEYQDVNPIQERIVRNLYEMGANVCVVGDDDQTIFQWRGSDIRFIQGFSQRYDNVKEVKLLDNFRSAPSIVDVALRCITNNQERLEKSMRAGGFQRYTKGDVLYNRFVDVQQENQFIVESIQNLRGVAFQDKPDAEPRGLDYGDMVILLRKWKKAEAIVEALQAAGIPFVVSGVNNLFQRPEVQASKGIFQYLNGELDADTLRTLWLDTSDALGENTLDEALKWLSRQFPKQDGYYESFNLQSIYWEFLDRAGIREEVYEEADASHAHGFDYEEVVFYNLGMFSQIINDYEVVNFMTEPAWKLKGFLSFLHYAAEDYYPEGWLNNSYRTPNAVQLMTIYQAKGLEFPVAFIPGLNKNYLPTSKPGGKSVWHFLDKNLLSDPEHYSPSEEDERRLMYVAITRSKKFLLMSSAPDGKMQGKESVFATEVSRSEYTIMSPQRNFAERAKAAPALSISAAHIALNFSLLKSFFDCPYSFKFFSFYGFVQPLQAQIGFGSSIHNTLMEVHREYLEGNAVPREAINSLLEKHMNFPYATEGIVRDMSERAQKSIEKYYDDNAPEFPYIQFAEKTIQLDLGDGILVNGKMDLIKKKNLDGSEERTIVDFKSSSDAQTYHVSLDQLKLYALGYRALTGENADFLTIYNLDENRPYKSELDATDLDAMRQKIVAAANDIRNNRLHGRCDKPDCVCKFKISGNADTRLKKRKK